MGRIAILPSLVHMWAPLPCSSRKRTNSNGSSSQRVPALLDSQSAPKTIPVDREKCACFPCQREETNGKLLGNECTWEEGGARVRAAPFLMAIFFSNPNRIWAKGPFGRRGKRVLRLSTGVYHPPPPPPGIPSNFPRFLSRFQGGAGVVDKR